MIRRYAAIALVAAVASAIPLAGHASVPLHVMTFELVGKEGKNDSVPYSQVARWVDWARVTYGQSGAIAAAGMKTVYYANPGRIGPKDQGLYVDNEAMFAHDCSGNRIATRNVKFDRYMTDVTSSVLQQQWRGYITGLESKPGVHFDAIFDDNAGVIAGLNGVPCNFNRDAYIQGNVQLIESLGMPVIYNGLSDTGKPGQYAPAPSIGLDAATNAVGGMYEGCFFNFNPNDPLEWGDQWRITIDEELMQAAQHKLFFCNAAGTHVDAAEATAQRAYIYASFMLGYDPATSVIEWQFETPSNVHVLPESQLVPTDPTAPEPGQVDALRVPSGTYVREYQQCYIGGSPVGPCAAIVNPDRAAHALGVSGYGHTLAFSGGGVLDNGSVSPTGPPPPGSLGPESAVIAFR
ncbi:MAG TPA: hypothetical protein VEJ20_03260 [Candidatus Eremiobacteraceae bacterium]|nr:hypothetical protein [Candidatus Eremiobacteraceae bacterium]